MRLLNSCAGVLAGLLCCSIAASAAIFIQPGKPYQFDGYLIVKTVPLGEGIRGVRFEVRLSPHPGGEHPPGLIGRQDIPLVGTPQVPDARLVGMARKLGPGTLVVVDGTGVKGGKLAARSIRVQGGGDEDSQPVRMVKVRILSAKISGNKLHLVVMPPNPCTTQAQLKVVPGPVLETFPGQTTLSIQAPVSTGCVLAVMPQPISLAVDLLETYGPCGKLQITLESGVGESMGLSWTQKP